MTEFIAWMADGGSMWVGIILLALGLILGGLVLLLITKGDPSG